MRIRSGARTDLGRARKRNEDSYLVQDPLFAVADGMGGPPGGDVASSLTVEILRAMNLPDEAPQAALVQEVKRANRRVLEAGTADRELRGMGTTVTAIVARDNKAHVAHVGDSRLYLLRSEGDLQQLTEDHSLVQRMVREGRLQPEEAVHHPQRSIVTRALGAQDEVDVDEITLDLHGGDRLLLCTDGLTIMVPPEQIQETLRAQEDPQAAADELVEAANRAGGDDNITVVVIDVVGDTDAAAPAVAAPDKSLEARARPRRSAVRRVLPWAAALVAVGGAAAFGGRAYLDRQWYVGESNGSVAIYRGIPSTLFGYRLSQVQEVTGLDATQAERLQPWIGLKDGITAGNLQDARAVVGQINQDLQDASTGTSGSGAPGGASPPPAPPSPSATPTPSPSGSSP